MRYWLLLAALILLAGSVRAEDVNERFASYVNALIDENYQEAADYWHPQYLETCDRLGITYRGDKFKYDCQSPLMENLDLIRSGAANWSIASTRIDPDHHKILVTISSPDTELTCEYFLQTDDDGSYFVPRFWLYLYNLSMVKTRYFDVFYRSEKQVNDFALYDLDQAVERFAAICNVTSDKLKYLEEQRMEYFLAETANEVAELLGFPSQGTYLKSSDIVISRYLPDYHEIARFMVSYTQDVGLYVEPFMERGLACMLGGRFGQSKYVMPQIAGFTLTNDIYSFDNILTFDAFHNEVGNIDFSFPLSLCMIEYITEQFTISKTLAALSRLSGDAVEIDDFSADDVKAVLTEVTGQSWEEIEAGARQWATSDPFPNLKPGTASDSGEVMFESGTGRFLVRITLADGWYNVFIKQFDAGTDLSGAMLMSGQLGVKYRRYKSFMFSEHFPDRGHVSEMYSLMFNGSEVGIYDYQTNRLVAKYVSGFDTEPRLMKDKEIRFRFREDVLRDRMDRYTCRLHIESN